MFREEISPLRQDVQIVNELSAELTPLDIQLSSTASRQLDQLNMRWKLLQVQRSLSGCKYFSHHAAVFYLDLSSLFFFFLSLLIPPISPFVPNTPFHLCIITAWYRKTIFATYQSCASRKNNCWKFESHHYKSRWKPKIRCPIKSFERLPVWT